jgi:hypothetical protein
LIYRCASGHISFAKKLFHCGMKGCDKPVDVISETDVEWFYKISSEGLAINETDLGKILADRNMPEDVKNIVRDTFPHLKKKGFRFW